jgi:hypothetical protein
MHLEAELHTLRSCDSAESAALMRAAECLREETVWPHHACAWFDRRAAGGVIRRERIEEAIELRAGVASRARERQAHWAALRRGLERRAARNARM